MQTLPYPGIATDYKPLVITMLSVADGVGIVTENLYPGRFRYVEELIRLGADVRTNGHHAVVRGVPRLSGAPVRAHDIRAGAAMVVAGLAAEGETVISGVSHIDRGYDDLVGRLRAVGADIDPLLSARSSDRSTVARAADSARVDPPPGQRTAGRRPRRIGPATSRISSQPPWWATIAAGMPTAAAALTIDAPWYGRRLIEWRRADPHTRCDDDA